MSKLGYKTNRQVLRKLVNEADDMTLVFIRERLLAVCDQYSDADQVRKDWKMPMFSPSIYISAAQEVKTAIDFK